MKKVVVSGRCIDAVFFGDCFPRLLIRTRSRTRPLELTSQPMIDLPEATIAQLLNEIGRGDEKAVTRLYRHYHGFLFAFIRHKLSNDADAEEVTQDVLMAVCKKPQTFLGQANFSTWLCGIAKFKVIDLRRKQGGGLPMAEVDDELIQEQADPNWNFVAQMEAEEDEEALRLCRDALPDEQKEAIFWVYHQGEGLETVAQRQACPVGTVKSRLFNARRRLHECMTRWMQGGRHA